MFTTVRSMIILICVLILAIPSLFAQIPISYTEKMPLLLKTGPALEKNLYLIKAISVSLNYTPNHRNFLSFINESIRAAIEEKEEKKILRQQWQELLRMDIFYPYFKAKEVEEWVSQKASVKFFNLKGKPEFSNNQIKYMFRVKF